MKHALFLCLALVLGGGLVSDANAGVVYPPAPDGGQKMISDFVGPILKQDPRFLGGFQMQDLTIASPYRDYWVPRLKDILAGKLLAATKHNGWTYLLMHGTNAVGESGLYPDPRTGNLRASELGRPTFHGAQLEAIRVAEQLPQVQKEDYEVRHLKIPQLLFEAMWFHGASDDIIIPLPNTFGRWNAFQPYTEREMLKLLKPEVVKKLKEPPGMID